VSLAFCTGIREGTDLVVVVGVVVLLEVSTLSCWGSVSEMGGRAKFGEVWYSGARRRGLFSSTGGGCCWKVCAAVLVRGPSSASPLYTMARVVLHGQDVFDRDRGCACDGCDDVGAWVPSNKDVEI